MTGALRGSGRTAALRLAADTALVLGDVANGVVEPSRLRDLTLRLVQGGGIQKKFAELMLPELQDDHDPPRARADPTARRATTTKTNCR